MSIDEKINDLASLHKQKKFADMYKMSLELSKQYPNHGELLNCLAVSNKELGNTDEAKKIFMSILALEHKPEFSHIFSNAGFLFFDSGEVQKSVEFHRAALKIDNKNAASLRGLGLAAENSGNAEEAINYYKKGLEIDKNDGLLNFHLANIYRIQNRFDKAIYHYDFSDVKLSKTNQLECIYKSNNEDLFNQKLNKIIDEGLVEPLVASLSLHASFRYDQKDKYTFCPNPFDYVCTADLNKDERFNDKFVNDLFEEINESNITKKNQSLLNNGFQSTGNLFLKDLPCLNIMEDIIRDSIKSFREKFANHNIDLINKWPKNFSILSWLIVMQKQGNLSAHMHKHGWVSGSVYLRMPSKVNKNEGDIKFSAHGGGYPTDNKLFPSKTIGLRKGSLVLFPSSLFHSTIPFSSDEERVTLAFDVIPEG